MDEDKSKKRALNLALWYLSKRAYSQKEIEAKLTRKEYSSEDVSCVITRLKELSFIDDVKFTQNYIRNTKYGKPKGKHRIRLELIKKGVDKELIDDELTNGFTEGEQEELIAQAAKSYLKKCSNLPKEKVYNRLMGFLLRRGFDYGKVSSFVKEALKDL